MTIILDFSSGILASKVSRNEKCHLESLLFIESWIAEAGVVQRQVVFVKTLGTTGALGHSISSELQVDTAKVAALLLVDLQCLLQLAEDVRELSCFDAAWGGSRVAVHRIALPDNGSTIFAAFHSADVLWEKVLDFASTIARDQSDLANFAVGVEDAEEGKKISRLSGWADFDANWVLDPAEVLDVRSVNLSSSITDPEEVSRRIIVCFVVVAEVTVGAWVG